MAHPIAAIATGFVRSGIGILRMSGDGCIDLANKVFTLSSKKSMSELPDRLLSRGTLYDEQSRPIDEALVFVSRAPHSYTGEDTVEFQCHGSPAVLRAGLSALLSVGFRQLCYRLLQGLQMCLSLLVVCLIGYIRQVRCTLYIVKSYIPSSFFFLQETQSDMVGNDCYPRSEIASMP